ncbi:MAG: DUF3306 domain-containing protein [Alphaproteobacteria bacterium]|nr:DUF3306 domain-containing protein [Alphaproteobacteria bacterium]
MSDDGFFKRWSRLKQEERERKPAEAPPAEPAPPAVPQSQAPEAESETKPSPELPPIESLTKDSDFTVFLKAGVPDELHRQALRKLWKSDPVFAFQDGLTDYAEDYGALFKGDKVVETAYKVGSGWSEVVLPEAQPKPQTPAPVGEGHAPEKIADKSEESSSNLDRPAPKRQTDG